MDICVRLCGCMYGWMIMDYMNVNTLYSYNHYIYLQITLLLLLKSSSSFIIITQHHQITVGERGVGKSVVLNQAVYYARKKGWLCIFVPQGWEQVQGR